MQGFWQLSTRALACNHTTQRKPCTTRRSTRLIVRASTDTQPAPAAASPAAGSNELVPDTEFSITKVSYGSILTPIGLGLLTYGFGAFFQLLPGADVSSILLIYGFPISVLGFALSYAQVRGAGTHAGRPCMQHGLQCNTGIRFSTHQHSCACTPAGCNPVRNTHSPCSPCIPWWPF